MNVVHKKDYSGRVGEKISQVDNVNRAGYVPLDIQYQTLMLSGARLDNIRDSQYNYDLQAFVSSGKSISDYVGNEFISRHYDKLELDSLLKDRLSKYSTFNSNKQRLEALKEQYNKEIALKEARQEAINNFKSSEEYLSLLAKANSNTK